MINNKPKIKSNELFALIMAWLIEVIAFVLLPLIIYIAIYFALGIEIAQIMKLPEWMFISIVLSGDSVRTQLAFYQGYQGFHVKAIRAISLGVILIVLSSIFLVFSLMAQLRNDFNFPDSYYAVQIGIFFTSFYFYATFSILERWQKGEGALQAYMRLRKGNIQDRETNQQNALYEGNVHDKEKIDNK